MPNSSNPSVKDDAFCRSSQLQNVKFNIPSQMLHSTLSVNINVIGQVRQCSFVRDRPPGNQWLKQLGGLSFSHNRKPRDAGWDGTGPLGSPLPAPPPLALSTLSPYSRMAAVGPRRMNGEGQRPFCY